MAKRPSKPENPLGTQYPEFRHVVPRNVGVDLARQRAHKTRLDFGDLRKYETGLYPLLLLLFLDAAARARK